MRFWSYLPSCIGNTTNQILLCGRFEDQLSAHNPRGRTTIVTSYDVANDITYIDTQPQAAIFYTMEVYWLPWMDGEVTSVSIAELDQSGCQYFLTSTFSGCRFVVTNEAVAHVAFSQNGEGIDSAARDRAEVHIPGPNPTRRRKLSITGSTRSVGTGNSSSATYGTGIIQNGLLQGNAVVLGYRMLNQWHFKALIDSDTRRFWFTLS